MVDKREELIKLIKNNDQIWKFVQLSIDNQIEGNAGWNHISTAEACGLTVEQLSLLTQLT